MVSAQQVRFSFSLEPPWVAILFALRPIPHTPLFYTFEPIDTRGRHLFLLYMQFLCMMLPPRPWLPTHIFLLRSILCFDSYVVTPPDRKLSLFLTTCESCHENFLFVLHLVSPAISLVDTFRHTFACTHDCISYSNTPNTGYPVLGVHINAAVHFFCHS